MSSESPFSKASSQQITDWYRWVMRLNHSQNPFDPADAGKSWKFNNNESVAYLAGVTATLEPAYKPSKIPTEEAQIAASAGPVVYNDGKGKPVQKLPPFIPREISLEGDTRDLYCPISTELATEVKYPGQANLQKLADKMIDKEGVPPPAFIELNGVALQNADLNDFRVRGSIDQLNVPGNNIFMLPSGTGKAAFSDYVAIVSRSFLKSGGNTLKFGVKGKFFTYTAEYKIKA